MGVYIWKERLPHEYQEVEYIESSGTQRIDTGVRPDDLIYGFECKFNLSSLPQDWNIMNLGGNSVDYYRYGFGGAAGTAWQIGGLMCPNFYRETVTDPAPATNVDYTTIYNYNGDKSWKLNGTTYVSSVNTGSYTYNVNRNIFCQAYGRGSYTRYAVAKLYYMKIWHGTTLIRDFVPCYRKSDNVIGMYDLVNNQFYANAGTGTFTKGQDINYVEHELKNAYIGEYQEGYKYLRWTITANRNNINVTQMSEFEICDNNGTKMSRPSGTSITGNIIGPGSETVDKIIDGSTSTKYCPNGSLPIIIIIDLGTTVDFTTYNKYKRYTANDESGRDPKSWTIEVSKDGSNWDTVSTVTNASIPTTRYALAGTWDITVN